MTRPSVRAALILVSTLIWMSGGCGGGGGSSTRLSLDNGRAATGTIGSAGGTITATAIDGTVYSLAIPVNSVEEGTSITLTPVTSIANLPFSGGLSAAVQFAPEGLVLAVPATLTVTLPAGRSASGLKPFMFEGDAADLHLYPAAVSGQNLTFTVGHFSGGGASSGNSSAQPTSQEALCSSTITQLDPQDPQFDQKVADAILSWYNSWIKPNLQQAAVDPNPLQILNEYWAWRQWATGQHPAALPAAPLMQAAVREADQLCITAMLQLIASYNAGCTLEHSKTIIAIAKKARAWHLSSQATGLDFNYVIGHMCLQVTTAGSSVPPTAAGQAATVTVKAGYTLSGGAPQYDQPMTGTITPSGATNNSAQTVTTNNGVATIPLTRDNSGGDFRIDGRMSFVDPALKDVGADVHAAQQGADLLPGTYTGTVYAQTYISDNGPNAYTYQTIPFSFTIGPKLANGMYHISWTDPYGQSSGDAALVTVPGANYLALNFGSPQTVAGAAAQLAYFPGTGALGGTLFHTVNPGPDHAVNWDAPIHTDVTTKVVN